MIFQKTWFSKPHLLKSKFFLYAKMKDLLHKTKSQTKNNLFLSKYKKFFFHHLWQIEYFEFMNQKHNITSVNHHKHQCLKEMICWTLEFEIQCHENNQRFKKINLSIEKRKMSGSNIKLEMWKNKMLHEKKLIIYQ